MFQAGASRFRRRSRYRSPARALPPTARLPRVRRRPVGRRLSVFWGSREARDSIGVHCRTGLGRLTRTGRPVHGADRYVQIVFQTVEAAIRRGVSFDGGVPRPFGRGPNWWCTPRTLDGWRRGTPQRPGLTSVSTARSPQRRSGDVCSPRIRDRVHRWTRSPRACVTVRRERPPLTSSATPPRLMVPRGPHSVRLRAASVRCLRRSRPCHGQRTCFTPTYRYGASSSSSTRSPDRSGSDPPRFVVGGEGASFGCSCEVKIVVRSRTRKPYAAI